MICRSYNGPKRERTGLKNDIAYAHADFIPGGSDYPDAWADTSRAYREREAAVGRARLNHPYGPGERQKMDIFHPAGKAEGLVVYVHGGYWLKFDRGFWSHFSAGLTRRGMMVAIPSYTLAPDARVRDITREVARAIEAAAALAPGPIALTGHSAGGHLVARMLCRDVVLADDVRARLSKVVPISPVADLRPLLDTTMNATLGLDPDEAEAESPVLHRPVDVPVTVWVGAEERPVFLDQARWLADAWGAEHRIAPGRHHFDVIDDLTDPDSPLVRALLG
ncbi:MAG: alpha/beta hydrolase [Silicimonas sp.]|nr:alpha/beta hydrolase [Silicimonas sp.]